MTKLVVDASVAAKWLVTEPLSDRALAVLVTSWELPDPKDALNRVLQGMSSEERRAFEAKLLLIRNAREQAQAKVFAESDKSSPSFLVW